MGVIITYSFSVLVLECEEEVRGWVGLCWGDVYKEWRRRGMDGGGWVAHSVIYLAVGLAGRWFLFHGWKTFLGGEKWDGNAEGGAWGWGVARFVIKDFLDGVFVVCVERMGICVCWNRNWNWNERYLKYLPTYLPTYLPLKRWNTNWIEYGKTLSRSFLSVVGFFLSFFFEIWCDVIYMLFVYLVFYLLASG